MRRLVVLGSTGMLGTEVSKVAIDSGIETVEISRSGPVFFDAEKDEIAEVLTALNLGSEDWLVNCIGWIPQKGSDSEADNKRCAKLLNEDLVREISEARNMLGFNWIQIGTDCVFSGSQGEYSENSTMDANDLYGQSKIEGEKFESAAINIRCSIVGPDSRSSAGLYSWFRSKIKNGESVFGYTNQFWNGVSTHAFARLVAGMVIQGFTKPTHHHWTPSDVVSKYDLLLLFAEYLQLPFGHVSPVESVAINRTLITNNHQFNQELWEIAGYNQVPSIRELCEEFISRDISTRGENA